MLSLRYGRMSCYWHSTGCSSRPPFDSMPLNPWSCFGPGIKLCAHCRWFSRPADQVCPESRDDILRTAKLQMVLRIYIGSDLLLIDQGRHIRLARHRRVCRLCRIKALGNERHMLLERYVLEKLKGEDISALHRLLSCHG